MQNLHKNNKARENSLAFFFCGSKKNIKLLLINLL